MKILLLEDDPVLSDILCDFLEESFKVYHAYNSKELFALAEEQKFDLYIFDINVTGQSGIEILTELRSFADTTPTIFITAYTDTQHLKDAFDAGAHDYIKKPFELEELYTRIMSTKRIFNIDSKQTITLQEGVSFNPATKELISDGSTTLLGTKDTKILLYFLSHQNRLVTNEELVQNVWDFDSLPSDATLRSHIRTLREAIGKEHIKTVRGSGYIYE